MTQTIEKHGFLAELERLSVAPERKKAFERFRTLGFPTDRDETWRFTDITPMIEIPFRLPAGQGDTKTLVGLSRGPLRQFQTTFVDGHSAPDLSTHPSFVTPLSKDVPSVDHNAFTALNDTFWSEGAAVHVPRGSTLGAPIHLLFLATRRPQPFMTHPRIRIVVEEGARAAVVESYLGPTGGVYLTNAVTEIDLGENATLDYYKVQRESHESFHFTTTRVRQARGSNFVSHAIALGALLSRNDLLVMLEGEGAEATVNGLYEGTGSQLVDNHTSIDHVKPHTTSRELYKGIMGGKSRGVFDGRIVVRPDAQKTNAMQTNRNLLLSKEALVHTKPQLEIFANDVKCKHGATIGQLDEDVLFYLRSRGIGFEEARRLLIHAFASEIVDQVRLDAIRVQLGGCLGMMVHS